MYDLDKDGYITREEMLKVVDSIYRLSGGIVKLPVDEDSPEKRVNKVFEAFDIVWRFLTFKPL